MDAETVFVIVSIVTGLIAMFCALKARTRNRRIALFVIIASGAAYIWYLKETAEGYEALLPVFALFFVLIPSIVGSAIGFCIPFIRARWIKSKREVS